MTSYDIRKPVYKSNSCMRQRMTNPAITVSRSGLSRRLNVSRAFIGKMVKDGLPIGQDGKIDLAVALAWVERHAPSGSKTLAAARCEPPLPLPALVAIEVAYAAPALAAVIAADAGAPVEVCFVLFRCLAGAMPSATQDILDGLGVDLSSKALWDTDRPVSPDWHDLAAQHGATFDEGEAQKLLARIGGGGVG
jgi:hypothetical protein